MQSCPYIKELFKNYLNLQSEFEKFVPLALISKERK